MNDRRAKLYQNLKFVIGKLVETRHVDDAPGILALAKNVRFVDPSIDLTGIDAFEANVIEVQGNIPAAVYARTSKVDEQHAFYRYHWAIHQHGKLLLQGFDTTELNDEGKVQLVIGFFGELSLD